VKWFRLSAAQGDPAGAFSLGFAYLRGDGVAADAKEAVAWLQKSAAQDFPSAEVMLGEIYLAGKVVEADEKLALQWFHKAANHGEPFAEASLGLMYAAGRGARHDKVQAYKWLTLALHELPRGKFRDAVTKAHDTVAGQLTSAQHERAEQQIAKFEPAPVGGKHGGVRGRTAPLNEPEPAGPIGTGSGFVVSAKGHIVTNDHVVAKCGQMRVRHLGADSMAAKVVVRDSANDLAVIQIAQAPAAIAVLRSGAEIRPGDGVVAIGFPLAGLLAEDANVTTGGVSALAGLRNDQRYLQISAPVQPGNSGGPLLDFGGNVVGVVSAKLNAGAVAKAIGDIPQNINFAIKISLVRQFLDANHIAYRTGAFGTRIEAADVGERAKTFTALVECWK
jgi:hypothetical protein